MSNETTCAREKQMEFWKERARNFFLLEVCHVCDMTVSMWCSLDEEASPSSTPLLHRKTTTRRVFSRRTQQLQFEPRAEKSSIAPRFQVMVTIRFERRRGPKAGDAFTPTRLMPTFGVSAGLSVQQKGRLRVQRWVRCKVSQFCCVIPA